MPLSDPVKHRLVEGAVGEVIPAELLQRTAEYGDNLVETLHAGHFRDFRGFVKHKGLEYAVAGACFVMPAGLATAEGRDMLTVDLSTAYCQWSFGWLDEPTIVREMVAIESTGARQFRHFIDCSIAGQVKTPTLLHATPEYGDTATGPAANPVVPFETGSKFRVYLGRIAVTDPDTDPKYTDSYELRWMRRVYLWAVQ